MAARLLAAWPMDSLVTDLLPGYCCCGVGPASRRCLSPRSPDGVRSEADAESLVTRLQVFPVGGDAVALPLSSLVEVASLNIRGLSSEGATLCCHLSEEFDDESICLIDD